MPVQISASTLEHQNRVNARNYKKKYSYKRREVFHAGPGDNPGVLAKKPAPLSIRELLGRLNACDLDGARSIVRQNRPEIIEWLKNGSFDAHDGADRLARHVKTRCYNVPEQAKFILELFKAAGLREQILYISSRNRHQNIAKLADKCLAEMPARPL